MITRQIMEGDKIIKTLKDCSTGQPVDLGKVYSCIKRFLSPLLSSTRGNAAKYELFCLKCLKACVDILVNSESVPNCYKDVVDILTEALSKCFGSNNKIPQLSCEKVLLHIVKEYYVKRCYTEQLKIAQLLQTLLRKNYTDQVIPLHKNIIDMLWRASSQLEKNLLSLQFRLTSILSMIDGKCSEQVVMENIIKCSSWYQMRSCDLLTFYNEVDRCLPADIELGNMSLYLCHYCKVCCDDGDHVMAEKCLKRLGSLSVNCSTLLEGIVLLIRTCQVINNADDELTTTNINKATIKLKAVNKTTILSAATFVIEWLNKLLTHSFCTIMMLIAVKQLEEEHYLPHVCEQKKFIVYKLLLNLLFALVKNIVEDTMDDKLLHQSTELVLSVIQAAETCCDKLGGANEYSCLGNIAFNIGLALSRGHCYMDSCPILSTACKLLSLSCNRDSTLIQKVQLASKYHLLYNCQRKAGYHDDALDTIAMEITCIPIKQLTDDGIPSYLLSCWVSTCSNISSQYRSIVDVLQPHLSDHVITTTLEAELTECRNNGSVEAWHDAIIRLATWYKNKGHGLLQARLLVERAEWCLYHGNVTVEYCNEALIVLDGCHSNTEEWHYYRGLVYLWLGVCHYSLVIRSCDTGSCDSVIDAMLNGLTEWEGVTMETSGIDHYHSYQLLQIILHLSSLLLEFIIQVRVVNIMICLTAGNHGDWMEKAHNSCLYQYSNVLIAVNVSSGLSSWQHDMSCDTLLICCKHHMIQGEISIAYEILQHIIQQCDHKDYYMLAEIKMLLAQLLLCRNPAKLLSSQSLLDHVRQRESTSPSSSKATSLELLLEALQLLRMLSKDVKPIDRGWLLLGKLLECLHHLIIILCWHGNCREAIYYCKEADNLCVEYKLNYWRVRFMNMMNKVELLRGQSSCDVMATMSTILQHSFVGDSLVCNHGNKKCWKDSNNPYYLDLMCHMIYCHTSFCDPEDIIGLVNISNQIAVFAAETCSKQLQSIIQSSKGADLSHYFRWVGLTGYTIHCRHLINIGEVSSAISLPLPIIPTHCCNAQDSILWAELSLLRGVALAEAVLDTQTFLKTCWCYHSNVKVHKVCVTSRKRSRDVLADSSPELPHPPVDTMPQQWTEDEPYDDIIFRSEQSTSYLKNLETKGVAKTKCKSGRGKNLTKKANKQKPHNQPRPLTPGICNEELWPAVDMLLLCYQLCHPVCCSVLLRDVCLWLATCIGHHDDRLTAYFLHRSHGNVLHHKMIGVCRKKYQSNNYKSFDTVLDLVKSADNQPHPHSTDDQPHPHSAIQHLLQWKNTILPPTLGDFDWLLSKLPGHTLVSLNPSPYCSPSHLILCRVQHNNQPLLHCVTSTADNPLDQFTDIISQAKTAAKSIEKSTFWRRRRQLNQDLEDLLITIERVWLGVWKILLLGDHLNDTALQDASEELFTIINSANGSCCNNGRGWLKLLISCIDQLSNSEVNEFLTTVTMGTVSMTHMREIRQVAQDFNSDISSKKEQRKPITILLGRMLHQFPWEQLPTLQVQPITRMPSLPVVVVHYIMLGKCDKVTVDTSNCYYMLNPSGNLGNTEKTFSKWFCSEPGWNGVVGKVTSEDHVINITKHQMFIYCGHGAGQEYLHGDNIQKLQNIATSFLIGCSSGQLVDVGRLDPNGTVLSYLMAGSPAVIANLWDVTDADTDRFCHALLQSWLHQEGTSLVSMVTPSRQHCKLPYLVGGAAVMYGFPYIINNKGHSFK